MTGSWGSNWSPPQHRVESLRLRRFGRACRKPCSALAINCSTWPRDHFCRTGRPPRGPPPHRNGPAPGHLDGGWGQGGLELVAPPQHRVESLRLRRFGRDCRKPCSALAINCSTWPRDHFCRTGRPPRGPPPHWWPESYPPSDPPEPTPPHWHTWTAETVQSPPSFLVAKADRGGRISKKFHCEERCPLRWGCSVVEKRLKFCGTLPNRGA